MELILVVALIVYFLKKKDLFKGLDFLNKISLPQSLFSDEKNLKGTIGEDYIQGILLKLPSSNSTLRNIYVPTKEGNTVEVDLVYITEVGIYVIESKNYSGWIFGNDQQKYWTQTLKSGEKNRFYNPVWQNEGHIRALSQYLQVDPGLFRSYIIFSNRCTIKEMSVSKKHVVVMNRSNLYDTLLLEMSEKPCILTKEKMEAFSGKLKELTFISTEMKERHIEQVQNKSESMTWKNPKRRSESKNRVVPLSRKKGDKKNETGKVIYLNLKE
ncbi:nuclease-related domain-containing protein [Proteiniclasticum ruminis]|uniref:nuclease-related domain-containing protein n=1 Tax=Proteiniclasticum ruminis TaxID=398199 RepID=UPI0028A2B6CE|nr:nuclease-related domain-containing protein [Proteiniclasticum ruminis]